MVYVEMAEGWALEKQRVAEIIRNRVVASNEYATRRFPKGEYGQTVEEVLEKKGSTGASVFQALDKPATKEKYDNALLGRFANNTEKASFLEALGVSINAFVNKTNAAGLAIQYNSPKRSPNKLEELTDPSSGKYVYTVTYPTGYANKDRKDMRLMTVKYAYDKYDTFLNNFLNSNSKIDLEGGTYVKNN